MIVRRYVARLGFILLLGFSVLGGLPNARAADAGPQVRAARMTVAQGSVTVNEPGVNGAGNAASVPGQVNLPLLSGVQVVTGNDGQAEIEFEDGSVVRLTPNSALTLDSLAIGSDGIFVTDMSLLRGLAYCELRATPQYSFVLNAGGDMISPVENTAVRVNFDQPPASFAVLDGTAQIERQGANGGYQAQVRAGETLQPDAADGSRYFLSQEIAADSWDQWNEDLDQAAAAGSANTTAVRDSYAGAEGYGWSDLDANGSWYNVPGEGEVWQPDVAGTDTSFDPYGNGAWVWSGGAGYVWASGYAWGWTPYRCGNWSYYNGFGWGWAPGAGCGGGGWGFSGGGNPVNIKRFPTGYHPIRVPTPRPGPVRPIVPVRSFSAVQGQPVQPQRGPRTIDGQAVSRIAPVRAPANGGVAAGSNLRRDFPINPANHSHELGLTSTAPAAVHAQPGQGPAIRQPGPANGVLPGYGNQRNPSPAQRSSEPELQRTAPSSAPQYQPGPRYEPRSPADHPAYSPPAQQTQPHSSPTPASHPSPPPPAQHTESAPQRTESAPQQHTEPPAQPRPSPK
jgi:hypothetical protein